MFAIRRTPCPLTLDEIYALYVDPNQRPEPNCLYASDLTDRRLVVYGAGSGFRTLQVSVLQPFALKPTLVLDRRFGHSVEAFSGYEACTLENTERITEALRDSLSVVTLGNSTEFGQAVGVLQQLGAGHVASAFEIFDFHVIRGAELHPTRFATFFTEHRSKIEAAYAKLADDPSRVVFRSALATYMHRHLYLIPSTGPGDQYLAMDVPMRRDYSYFVDCGAYDGSDITRLRSHFRRPLECVVCFEPDRSNARHLAALLRTSGVARSGIVVPTAVGNIDGLARFSAGLDVNSFMDAAGEDLVPLARLDTVLAGFSPTFVKMDIEGAELDALYGARDTLCSLAPDLAVCVYHQPSHLWDAILLLDSLGVGYRFYLRNHTSWIAETVLYATTAT